MIPLPRPHIPITINAIWALSDFTRGQWRDADRAGQPQIRSLAGIRQGLRCRHRDHAGRQRDAVRQRALAWRRRQYQRCQALCILLRLLLGLDAAAGKPAARHSPGHRAAISAAAAGTYAATASTRDSSATSTTAIRSNYWAASAANAWCGKQPTSGRRGLDRNVSRGDAKHRTRNPDPGSRYRTPWNDDGDSTDLPKPQIRRLPSFALGLGAVARHGVVGPGQSPVGGALARSSQNRASAQDAPASRRSNRRCR